MTYDFDPEMGFFDETTKPTKATKKRQPKQKRDDDDGLLDMVIDEAHPFVVRGFNEADGYHIHRVAPNGVSLWERSGLKAAMDAMISEGFKLPKVIPVAQLYVHPKIDQGKIELCDTGIYRVNKYSAPTWMSSPAARDMYIEDVVAAMVDKTPVLSRYFDHITSGDERMKKTLLLWIVAQIRHEHGRLRTSWLIRGGHGTGKSMLVERVIKGLMTQGQAIGAPSYVVSKSVQNLKEQYNTWVTENLFVLVNEADISALPFAEKKELYNKVKSLVADASLTVRAMYKEQVASDPICAFVFTSNEADTFPIEPGDRRFHVMPWCDTKVAPALGFGTEIAFINAIDADIPALGELLGRIQFRDEDWRLVDMPAMTVEKLGLISSSRSRPHQFIDAVREGDLNSLWLLMAEALYDSPDIANDPTIKPVIGYVASVVMYGGTVHIPSHLAEKMYQLAVPKGPRLTSLLVENRLVSTTGAGKDRVQIPEWLQELAQCSERPRGIKMRAPWVCSDEDELRTDRFISAWIAQAIKRMGIDASVGKFVGGEHNVIH